MTNHTYLRFGATSVSIGDAWSFVILPGGGSVPAAPHDDEHYRATAQRLGYGDDTARMCREHDALHVALCHFLGLPASPTLSTVAGIPVGDAVLHGLEEDAVCAVTKFANAAGIDLGDLLRRLGETS